MSPRSRRASPAPSSPWVVGAVALMNRVSPEDQAPRWRLSWDSNRGGQRGDTECLLPLQAPLERTETGHGTKVAGRAWGWFQSGANREAASNGAPGDESSQEHCTGRVSVSLHVPLSWCSAGGDQ